MLLRLQVTPPSVSMVQLTAEEEYECIARRSPFSGQGNDWHMFSCKSLYLAYQFPLLSYLSGIVTGVVGRCTLSVALPEKCAIAG